MPPIPTITTVTAASLLAVPLLLYANASLSFSYDYALLRAILLSRLRHARLQRRDRLNLFYCLEELALSPQTGGSTFLVCPPPLRQGGDDGERRNVGRRIPTWSFREVYEEVLRYAGWLEGVVIGGARRREKEKEKGIGDVEGKGGREVIIALDFTNCPEFVFLWFAVWSLGWVPAFINYNLAGAPLVHSVRVSTATVLIVDPEIRGMFTPEVEAELTGSSSPSSSSVTGEGDAGGTGGVGGRGEEGDPLRIIHFDHTIQSTMRYQIPLRAPDSARANALSRDPAILISTSGTTGAPKPAIASWAKLQVGGRFVSHWLGLRPATHKRPDRFYSCMPLYHSSASVLGLVNCLMNGTTFILGRRFSVGGFWGEVRETQGTVVQYVGEMCRYLLAAPAEIDPEGGGTLDQKHMVRIAFGNGLRPDVWEKFKTRFGISTIAEFYAATEGMSGSWNLSCNSFSAGAVGRTGTLASWVVGRETCLVKVDYETETPMRDLTTGLCIPVPRGQKGEVLYRLDERDIADRFQGYFHDDSSTDKKIIRNVLSKGDAWFRTGDVLIWDREGRWWFIDRLGDTFRWKSENVSTAEVAQTLGLHPRVVEANVYGVQVPGHEGRAGCAAVTLDLDGDGTTGNHATGGAAATTTTTTHKEELLAHLATFLTARLPRYSVPLFLRLVTHMQRTGTLKQQKHILRREGVDVRTTEGEYRDEIWWLRRGCYVRFTAADWEELVGGRVKL